VSTNTKTPDYNLEETAAQVGGLPEITPEPLDSLSGQSPSFSLTENSPIVAFDVNLGKKYKHVDFDYEAYDRELQRQGMPQDAKPLTITVSKNGSILSGHYQNGEIAVVAGKHTNRNLKHEIQHAVNGDDVALAKDRRYRVGLRAAKIAPALIGADLSALAADSATHIPAVESAIARGSLPAVLLAGGLALWGYHLHPAEKRARHTERQPSTGQIVSFTKK
jgi:hypothetical protein